jgi:hypothetical protein
MNTRNLILQIDGLTPVPQPLSAEPCACSAEDAWERVAVLAELALLKGAGDVARRLADAVEHALRVERLRGRR